MSYIDPSGEIVWFIPVIIGAVIGSYVGGAMANGTYNPLKWDWSSGHTWSNMGFGALIGGAGGAAAFFGGAALGGAMCSAMGVGTGGAVGGAVMGFSGGMIGGFINGAGFTGLGGGNFEEIMMGGFKGAAIGGGTGALAGGIFGGISAYRSGNNVWSGEAIAEGRNAFSFKNTPVDKINIQQTEGAIPSEIKKHMTSERIAEIESQNNWIQSPSDKPGGIIYKDPNNSHNSIRFMPGNPNSPNPAQQNPYVIYRYNGAAYDINGFPLPKGNLPNAHIPLNLFDINKMPKFK